MFERYAIFHTPTGAFADWGAAWLGWDSEAGCAVAHPQNGTLDVAKLTARPRKYGLHGTLKAPFHLAQDRSEAELRAVVAEFARTQPATHINAMTLQYAHGFVALRPADEATGVRALAADVVTAFEPFRAPLGDADIARRRKARLTPQQDAQLLRWGYPFVFDDFNFHLTLSGRLRPEDTEEVTDMLKPQLDALVPTPYPLDTITLMGQDADGMFHQIARHTLEG